MPFDITSGLVFAERVAREPRPAITAAKAATRCLGRKPRYVSLPVGAHRLVDIAMRKLLRNLKYLDSSSLATVPTIMLEKIWLAICRSQLNSLQVWQAFAQSSIGTRTFVRTFGMPQVLEITFNKSFPLITSTSFAWLTHLSISTPTLTQTDLLGIASVTNIRKLYIDGSQCPRSSLDDRIFRAWAEAAVNDGAFTQLGSILLWNQENVSRWTLDRLNAFPKLREFCAFECSLSREDLEYAARNAWLEDSNTSLKAQRGSRKKSADSHAYRSWQDFAVAFMGRRLTDPTDGMDQRPLLNASLGPANPHRVSSDWLIEDELFWIQKGYNIPIPTQHMVANTFRSSATAQPALKRRKLLARKQIVYDDIDYDGMGSY